MFGGLMKTKLYSHQRENLKFLLAHARTADFSQMGTGKTLTTLAKIAHLIASGKIRNVLVVCPASVIPVWEEQIAKHTNLSCLPLTGSLWDKGSKLRDYQYEDIYLISYDSISGKARTKNLLLNVLRSIHFDMLVADEVTFIKNYETQRFQAILKLCDDAKYTLFLTGTPIGGRPDSIFTIYRALDGGETFGTNFFRARNKYFKNVGIAFPIWVIRDTMKDELTHKMYLKAVRVRKEDCLSLPKKVFSPRYCTLSQEQQGVYDQLAKELVKRFRIGQAKISIPNPLVRFAKLSQICSGFLYGKNKETYEFGSNTKTNLLKEVLEEIGNEEKIIIYTRWKEDQRIVQESLAELRRTHRCISGATTIDERKEIVKEFQENPSLKVLVANITVGGYALTLTAASCIIYYTLNFALTDWLQSQDRIHRIGQTKTCVYIPLLVKGSIDEFIYHTLQDKIDVAETIVDGKSIERLKRYL